MKKAYIAPETVTIHVETEAVILDFSVDSTGNGGSDGEKDTAIEGNPDEVGAKGDLWGSGDDDLW